jgi:maltose O-acetyltransferase
VISSILMGEAKRRMLRGELYVPSDPELHADHRRCHELLKHVNATASHERDERSRLLGELFGTIGAESGVKPPFHCDYGYNISLGRGVFVNYDCVFLDTMPITIGDGTQIGPAVQIYAADHPREPDLRRQALEFSRPVAIGANVWIGGGAILCPGVTVGDDSVVGAGSVVTRDIPPSVVAAGNPCRVIRPLEAE